MIKAALWEWTKGAQLLSTRGWKRIGACPECRGKLCDITEGSVKIRDEVVYCRENSMITIAVV